ncbi:MAG: HEPN domain-containing protein [Candidatus Poribacteria bacterium]
MNVPDIEIIQQVIEWVSYAEDDLLLANYGLTLAEKCPYRLIAYHAQQCAEKYLKAYLIFCGIDFPYTHDISELLELCGYTGVNWVDELQEAEELTLYATATRYPRVSDKVSKEEAYNSISIADRLRQVIREELTNSGITL